MSRYKPGDWIEGAGGTKVGDYVLPEITTLLLVGPRGAGKSTLVNRITRVFDKDVDPFAPDRVQVSRKLDNLFKCCFSW
jgi:stage III sporulation protein SpoIIIAA